MIGEFAVLFRDNGAPVFIAELNDLNAAVEKANEVAESRQVECLVYCYSERRWKYRANPAEIAARPLAMAS